MTNPIILIIDDEQRSHYAVQSLLEGQSYRLEFAENGPSGLKRAHELRPDLILLDVMMPGMDGFEVCRNIRGSSELQQIPVLMLTALDDPDSRLEGLNAGADDFISKPFVRREMLARINTILKLNRYRRLYNENIRLLWILDQSPDAYLILDKGDRITYANAVARRYLNLTSEELPDESLLSIAARQYQLEPRDAWETWPAAGDLPRYLVRPETITAQAFWLRLEQLPEPRELEQERTIRLTDISEQITSRADIRKFHNTLVHKLNTPLSGIWGGASLLKKHVGEGKEDGIAELAYLIENSASRLHQAIDDVINYTAASNLAHQGCYFQYAALSDLFREKATELKIATPHLLMPPQLTELASGLSDKAMQVIVFELLENAKKFHPTHTPTVSVTVEQQADEYVTINIRDDGINLSPNQLKWAMIPYVQGEKYFTGELDGMGLGLPVVSTLVWQSGGSISLHNRSDRPGLEVKLSLPVV